MHDKTKLDRNGVAMWVSEAIGLDNQAHSKPVEIEGKLIVSRQITCIVDENASPYNGFAAPGIWVPQGVLFQLDALAVPHLAGSMVSLVGEIALKGTMTHTGLPPLPKCIPYVYEYSFSMRNVGSWRFVNGDTFKNLYLDTPYPVSTNVLAVLKPLFPLQLTVMQLRALLASKASHLVAEHVRGDELARLTAQMDAAGCAWHSEECEIRLGGHP